MTAKKVDYDALIKKVEQFKKACSKTTNKFAEVEVALGKDFEDLKDFASAMATIASFGTTIADRLYNNLLDEGAAEQGG